MTNGQSLIGCVDKTPTPQSHRTADRREDLLKGDVLFRETTRIDHHLVLAIVLPPNSDVGNSWDRHKPGADNPAGRLGHLHLRQGLGADPDLEHTTGRRERWQDDRGPSRGWQSRGGQGESFLHILPGHLQVRATLQYQYHRGEPQHGLGAQGRNKRGAGEGVLYRYRDQSLNFFSGKARCFGLYLYFGRGELRKHVHFRLAE